MNVLICIKQVPRPSMSAFDERGHQLRSADSSEMNPYCRRALAKGVELAHQSGGIATVVTVGPPSAELVLREALAYGADSAVHLCDPLLAGSDAFVTARAIAAVIDRVGPFDLVMVGKASTDAETALIGPMLAGLLGLTFAGIAKSVTMLDETSLRLECERDDGSQCVDITLPAIVAAAERLIQPARASSEDIAVVSPTRIQRLNVSSLSDPGPWGTDASPTAVRGLEPFAYQRTNLRLDGDLFSTIRGVADLVGTVLNELDTPLESFGQGVVPSCRKLPLDDISGPAPTSGRSIMVLIEPESPRSARALLGRASQLASELDADVAAVVLHEQAPPQWHSLLPSWGADQIFELLPPETSGTLGRHLCTEEEVADSILPWIDAHLPTILLAPATCWGREITARLAATRGVGLISDAVELQVVAGRLIAKKPAPDGYFLASVVSRSPLQIATVRCGHLHLPIERHFTDAPKYDSRIIALDVRKKVVERWSNDSSDALDAAPIVIGVGVGVDQAAYPAISTLAELLGAEIAATRRVTDAGWLPRSRQIGITGKTVSPRLYISIGASGKLNHTIGFRQARTVIAINSDPSAPLFDICDLGVVCEWQPLVEGLIEELRSSRTPSTLTDGCDPLGGTRYLSDHLEVPIATPQEVVNTTE